jgi:hypothetical protein
MPAEAQIFLQGHNAAIRQIQSQASALHKHKLKTDHHDLKIFADGLTLHTAPDNYHQGWNNGVQRAKDYAREMHNHLKDKKVRPVVVQIFAANLFKHIIRGQS